jgi:hypothetical protein
MVTRVRGQGWKKQGKIIEDVTCLFFFCFFSSQASRPCRKTARGTEAEVRDVARYGASCVAYHADRESGGPGGTARSTDGLGRRCSPEDSTNDADPCRGDDLERQGSGSRPSTEATS